MNENDFEKYKEQERSLQTVSEFEDSIELERVERERAAADGEMVKAESEWLRIKRDVERRIARPLRVAECVLGQPVTRTTAPHHIPGWYGGWNQEAAALGLYGGFDLDGRFDTHTAYTLS